MMGIETFLMSNAMWTATVAEPGAAFATLTIVALLVSSAALIAGSWRTVRSLHWFAAQPLAAH